MARSTLGHEQPRVFTPPLRALDETTTLGYAAIEFAEDVCGLDLYPWQRWLLIHALELAPDLTVETIDERGRLDPMLRFRKVVVLVARQNGKSTLGQVLSLFFMYVLGTPLVLGTAQDLDTAEEVWEGAQDLIDETPVLAAQALKPIRRNGKQTIRLVSGERYKVKAATRRAARGLTGDLIILDELREHQSWDAWSAITKTTMARPAAQIWALSNAGDPTSVVLRYLRRKAHADLGDPDGIIAADDPSNMLPTDEEIEDFDLGLDLPTIDDMTPAEAVARDDDEGATGLFEWSAAPDREVDDLEGLAQANPSLGHGISVRTLLGDARDDPEPVFRTECLCQWVESATESIFPDGTWEEQADDQSRAGPGNRITACLTIAWDRSRSHIAIAGQRADGKMHIGIVASRPGTDWVADWLLSDDAPPFESLVVQARGAPESSLLDELQRYKINVTMWEGPDLARAHGTFFDAVQNGDDGTLRHRIQPILEVAVATATTKPMGEAWVLDLRKSAADAAPLKGVIGALWALTSVEPPRVSAYENRGVLSI